MTHVVYIDTETTGLYPEKGHEVWEIALIVDSHPDPTVNGAYLIHVHPTNLNRADPYALKLSRFYERSKTYSAYGKRAEAYVVTAPIGSIIPEGITDTYTVAAAINHLTRGAHIVGAVPDFDVRFLKKFAADNFDQFAPHYHLIDVEVLAVGALAESLILHPIIPPEHQPDPQWLTEAKEAIKLPYDSERLSKAVGIAPPTDEERHTALGDAMWAKRLYERLTQIVNP